MSALFAYPKQAEFGRVLPKNKIYEHSGANTRLKDLFVEQVERIVWRYKLAPETINLASKPGVPEIQVFAIQLKTPELHHDVLRCIDGAVQFPIIFDSRARFWREITGYRSLQAPERCRCDQMGLLRLLRVKLDARCQFANAATTCLGSRGVI
jgi:hypothetical protein